MMKWCAWQRIGLFVWLWCCVSGYWGIARVEAKIPQAMRIVVVGAKILPVKADGRCWDLCFRKAKGLQQLAKRLEKTASADWASVVKGASGASGAAMPDAYAILRFDSGQTIRTHTIKDSLMPRWGTTEAVSLRSGERVEIALWDEDLRYDDLIGQRKLAIPSILLAQGGMWTIRLGQAFEVILHLIREKPRHGSARFLAGLYDVTLRSARISPYKADGSAWDPRDGKPDPYATLRLGKHTIQTKVERDTLLPTWGTTQRLYLTGKEEVEIRVMDRDPLGEEEIGVCRMGALEGMRLIRRALLHLRCGRVEMLKIHFRLLK
jgi:hypothetical protein